MSGLNCKPGDLAVVVRHAGRIEADGQFVEVPPLGLIVRCVHAEENSGHMWVIEETRVHLVMSGGMPFSTNITAIGDEYLRPLRDSGGEDEMLRIAGRPEALEVA